MLLMGQWLDYRCMRGSLGNSSTTSSSTNSTTALLSIFTFLFLPSSSVSLYYFILAVSIYIYESVRENTLARVPHFLIAIQNGTLLLREEKLYLFWPKLRLSTAIPQYKY